MLSLIFCLSSLLSSKVGLVVVSFLGLDESDVRVGLSFVVTKGYFFPYLGILLSLWGGGGGGGWGGGDSMLLLVAGSTFSRGTNVVILFGGLSVALL